MRINVREFLGENFAIEDAIVLREYVENNLSNGVELDFDGIGRISTCFLQCLFTDLIYKQGRDFINTHVCVKNLSNYRDYSRVVNGTTFN